MAFDFQTFGKYSSHGSLTAPMVFIYRTKDLFDYIEQPAYFDSIQRKLHVGDLILINNPEGWRWYEVLTQLPNVTIKKITFL